MTIPPFQITITSYRDAIRDRQTAYYCPEPGCGMLVTQELQSVFCQECDSDGGYGYDGDAYGGGDGGYVGGYGGDSGGSTATVSLQSEARSVLTKAFIEAR